jgi:rubredoxin
MAKYKYTICGYIYDEKIEKINIAQQNIFDFCQNYHNDETIQR